MDVTAYNGPMRLVDPCMEGRAKTKKLKCDDY